MDLSGKRLVALTGAGISAESGVPTFRGPGGLWRGRRPEDLATPEAFARDPRLVLDWYEWRRGLIAKCRPNAAQEALSKRGVAVVTQNVDGLHGPDAIELHGNIWRTKPCGCCGRYQRPDVVWFGESLDPAVLRRATEAVGSCDVLLVIGTSGVVQPAAGLVRLARRALVINPDPAAAVPGCDFIRGTACGVVPRLLGLPG